jgi:hypothetical protein
VCHPCRHYSLHRSPTSSLRLSQELLPWRRPAKQRAGAAVCRDTAAVLQLALLCRTGSACSSTRCRASGSVQGHSSGAAGAIAARILGATSGDTAVVQQLLMILGISLGSDRQVLEGSASCPAASCQEPGSSRSCACSNRSSRVELMVRRTQCDFCWGGVEGASAAGVCLTTWSECLEGCLRVLVV